MEAFLPDTAEAILLGVIAMAFLLVWLARTFPQFAWLKAFQFPAFRLNDAQRARRRRTADRIAALQIMGLGLVLPFGYVVLTIMMFNDFETTPTVIVGACSVFCIALGIWGLVRNH